MKHTNALCKIGNTFAILGSSVAAGALFGARLTNYSVVPGGSQVIKPFTTGLFFRLASSPYVFALLPISLSFATMELYDR